MIRGFLEKEDWFLDEREVANAGLVKFYLRMILFKENW